MKPCLGGQGTSRKALEDGQIATDGEEVQRGQMTHVKGSLHRSMK